MTEAEATKEQNEEDMSPEERLAWLRERGVLVETAEERKRTQVVAAMKMADDLESSEPIAYVHIPADTSKPMNELTYAQSTTTISVQKEAVAISGIGGNNDALLEHLRPAFSKKSNETVDTELLKQQQPSLLGSGDTNIPTVSEATLQKVAEDAHIEVFTILQPIPSNNFTSVQIYLDEVGMMKRLPLNKRASDLAARAGFNPPPIFYGDVFVGRSTKAANRNISFRLQDVAPDAPWLMAATTHNLEYQMERNKITGQNSQQQPAVSGTDGNTKQEDGYAWTQTEQELEVRVELPSSPAATSKDVKVKFKSQQVDIVVSASCDVAISLPLFERVDVDGCTWTLEKSSSNDDSKQLVITMEKLEEALWPRICD